MKVAVFSSKKYDMEYFRKANVKYSHDLVFFESRLNSRTASLAAGFPAVCAFVNDELDAGTLDVLASHGTKLIALRCAGFNNVDLTAAEKLGLTVMRVPEYSPHAVAEHAVALILVLNRKIHRAYNRSREGNFALDGLMGFDLYKKTVGIIGTGRIGTITAGILKGFGCEILAYDVRQNPACIEIGAKYTYLTDLFKKSDIISLHAPLTPETYHLINEETISLMKDNVMIINTSRGKLIDTNAVIDGLKSGKIGYLGIDVYEEESDLFFENLSDRVIQDDVLARLFTLPNAIVTGHQAFFTHEALTAIAETTLFNICQFEGKCKCDNEVCAARFLIKKPQSV